jgi:hypothetical protein
VNKSNRPLQFPVQVNHPGYESDHAIMPGDIGKVIGVDATDWMKKSCLREKRRFG